MLVIPTGGHAQIRLSLRMTPAPVISVLGPAGTPCQVQWTDSITGSNEWSHLGHAVTGTGSASVQDTAVPSAGGRFYRALEVPSQGMVYIPGGTFAMGDAIPDGQTNERPVHNVSVSAFFMDGCEVTMSHWDSVYHWATNNGYGFSNRGLGKGTNHPVQTVNWHDAVKWCNARSQKEGRTPVYYTTGSQTTLYKTGEIPLTNGCVRWSASGYRLPTEAEWERAARGDVAGGRFPCGATLSHSNANYCSASYLTYDITQTNGFHPAFAVGDLPFTSPVGWFPASAYGLRDMVGNVWEWCWDGYDPAWYGKPGAVQADTRGPELASGSRVVRGGSWLHDAYYARCANRFNLTGWLPAEANDSLGFRCVASVALRPAVLGVPTVLPGGFIRFTVSNLTPGKTNIVAVSTNLVTWMPVWTNVPSASTMAFTNAPAPGLPRRFYRTWQLP